MGIICQKSGNCFVICKTCGKIMGTECTMRKELTIGDDTNFDSNNCIFICDDYDN